MNPMPDDDSCFGPTRFRNLISLNRPPRAPAYRVGERFRAKRQRWPHASEYSFGPSGHELTLFRPEITRGLIHDVGKGPAEFALIVESPIFVLAYRFGDSVPWGDTPYCWHLQPASRRMVPPWEPRREDRTLLWVTLVGGDDGIIHAQRGLTLSPEFTRSLHEMIRDQAMGTFDSHACVTAVGSVFSVRGSVEDRLGRAAVRSTGNA